MSKGKNKRLNRREQQRINTTRSRFGKKAFSDFGRNGGRGNKK